jgi:hypothetical protein
MVDGSRWIVYYRLSVGSGYADTLKWVRREIAEAFLRPADDPDGVQRRLAQVNMAYVVSVRDPIVPAGQDGDDR